MNQEMLAVLAAMAGNANAGSQSLVPQVKIILWDAFLLPVDGKEDDEFSLEKYLHTTDGKNGRFVAILEKPTDDVNDIETTSYTYFTNTTIGKALERDIKNKDGKRIDPETGKFRKGVGGNYATLPLSGDPKARFDIHYLDKAGNQAEDASGRKIMPSLNRTTEKVFLTTPEINNMQDTIEKFQNRVKKQTGDGKRYRFNLSEMNTSAPTAPPIEGGN